MVTFWKISRQNPYGHTQFLCGVRPTLWTIEEDHAQRFNDHDAVVACRWLIQIGVSFTIRQFSIP